MRRRHFVQTAATLPLAALFRSNKLTMADALPPRSRVRTSDPSWPDAAKWARLREAVGGQLIEVHSMFGPCEAEPNGTACANAVKSIKNPYWIADQPGGTEISGWLDAWTPAPSAYALKARNTADVVAGITFARENNLRLVVKGGGHSYQGTSDAPDSLLIWTRAMSRVTLHNAFVGQGCEGHVEPVPAVSAQAGAVWMDLYHAVTTQAGRYVQGGGCMTVGVAGIIQSGGFGSYSKRFGTAAAGLLEAEVVTADGRVRVVNACSDPDLFWAIKGGGGGTFGVITRLTLRTHDLPKFFGGAGGKIKAKSDEAFRRLIARFIDFYHKRLFNPHWGEKVHFWPDNTLEISMACAGLDAHEVREVWEPFFSWVKSSPADFAITSRLFQYVMDSRGQWDASTAPWLVRDPRNGVPGYHAWNRGDDGECGAFLYGYDSLWLPATLLQSPRRNDLVNALFAASRHKLVRLHIAKGLAGAPQDAIASTLQTAMNPAVVDAFTLVIIADGDEMPAYPGFPRKPMDLAAARKSAREIHLAAAQLRKLVPNAGSYVSESDYFNASWQRAFWGENYSRLRAIKRQYDPDGLFIVHHGVGSEDWSNDGFTRMT
jgi:FAD/FMN-containing dehydrogenase